MDYLLLLLQFLLQDLSTRSVSRGLQVLLRLLWLLLRLVRLDLVVKVWVEVGLLDF